MVFQECESAAFALLAEKRDPLRSLPVKPNNPRGLSILSDGFSPGCAYSARTRPGQLDLRILAARTIQVVRGKEGATHARQVALESAPHLTSAPG